MVSASRTLCAASAIALLAGCVSAPGAMPQSPVGLQPAQRGGSWMLPKARKLRGLIYDSDWYSGDVYVIDYQSRQLVGELTGFHEPMGQCEDSRGDVWITDQTGEDVVEYAHGGTSPLKTLQTGGYSNGCSFSPHGDLAVANLFTASGAGSIAFFKNASGTPTQYVNASQCYYVLPAGYDDKGNLYAEVSNDSANGVCELAAGGSALKAIAFNRTINDPGSVMWDGKHITLTDAVYGSGESAIYQARRSSGGLTAVGTTALGLSGCDGADIFQPFIVGKVVLGAETLCSGEPLGFWHYPAGGDAVRSLSVAAGALYVSVSFAR
jgi:hypothetical protein